MVEWFNNLSDSDRRVLALGAILILPLILYATMIAPLEKKVDRYAMRLNHAQDSVNHLLEIVAEYRQLEGGKPAISPLKNDVSLLFIVDKSSQTLKVKKYITRLTPVGHNKVRFEFKKTPFDRVMSWLVLLEKDEGVQIERIHFKQTNRPGMVSGKLTLFRDSIEGAG